MEPQSLRLIILRGPRNGETFEYPPKSTIKIGRVVRGNNLSIKDEGISSKHLVIRSESPSSGKWVVQDLDSSNGTTLNSSILTPFTEFPLNDGDTLKFGEDTSILVKFHDFEEMSQLRRNPRRKVKSEIQTTEVERGRESNVVRRGRPRKDSENVERVNVRVTRNRKNEDKKEESESAVVIETEEKESEVDRENVIMQKPPRGRGRPVKAKVLEDKELGNLEKLNLRVLEDKELRNVEKLSLRVTRNRKNDELDGDLRKKSENVGLKEVQLETEKVNSRVTSDTKNKDCVHFENLDGKMTRQGRGRRKNLQGLASETLDLGLEDAKEQVNEVDIIVDEEEEKKKKEGLNEQVNEVDINGDEEKKEGSDLREEAKEQVNEVDHRGNEECEDIRNGISVEESVDLGLDLSKEEKEQANEVHNSRDDERKCENGSSDKASDGKEQVNESEDLGKQEVRVDLEKMNFEQWFDYMEYSQKQTFQAVQEIIEGMRMKAERVKEHIREQKKAQAVAMG